MTGIPLSSFGSTATLATVYNANPPTRSTLIVLVEGDDDLGILERWFAQELKRRVVAFSTPRAQGGKADGCEGVIQVATTPQTSGVPIFGIVDRDYLVSANRLLFLEENDAVFVAKSPHSPHVRVLRQWEIENYLLDTDALMRLYADYHGNPSAAALGATGIENLIASVVESVLLLTATNIVLRDRMIEPFDSTWRLNDTMTKLEMQLNLDNALYTQKLSPADRVAFEAERTAMLASLKAFGGGHREGTREYIRGLLRIVDGKAVFRRILQKLRTNLKDTVAKRMMASHMAHTVPVEVIDHIESFKAAAVSGAPSGTEAASTVAESGDALADADTATSGPSNVGRSS